MQESKQEVVFPEPVKTCKNCLFARNGESGLTWCRFWQEHQDMEETCPYFTKKDMGVEGYYNAFLIGGPCGEKSEPSVCFKRIDRGGIDMLISLLGRQENLFDLVIRPYV